MSALELICNGVLALCAVVLALNWLGLVSAVRDKSSYSFSPPFLAGIFAALALAVHPHPRAWLLVPVALALDPSILAGLWAVVRHVLALRK